MLDGPRNQQPGSVCLASCIPKNLEIFQPTKKKKKKVETHTHGLKSA